VWKEALDMKIQNYMEEIVENELEFLLNEHSDICKCQKCKYDMMLFALNRLPPRYVMTDRGRIYTKLKEQEAQFKADVIKELTRAIKIISENPQH
jgi:competence protein ComFB